MTFRITFCNKILTLYVKHCFWKFNPNINEDILPNMRFIRVNTKHVLKVKSILTIFRIFLSTLKNDFFYIICVAKVIENCDIRNNR